MFLFQKQNLGQTLKNQLSIQKYEVEYNNQRYIYLNILTLASVQAIYDSTYKEILESFLFCMYLGSFTLPL